MLAQLTAHLWVDFTDEYLYKKVIVLMKATFLSVLFYPDMLTKVFKSGLKVSVSKFSSWLPHV